MTPTIKRIGLPVDQAVYLAKLHMNANLPIGREPLSRLYDPTAVQEVVDDARALLIPPRHPATGIGE